jgi:L-threonylcarbamoyladenylate synthase
MKSLAFRLPKKVSLLQLIQKTGPLVAPSANPEKQKPAENITELKKYFGKEVDFYVQGKVNKLSSTLVEIKKGGITILRPGAKKIK